MCDYCDCREVAPIGELSLEHETISELAATLRKRLIAGGDASAELTALQGALRSHLRKEEEGLFAELERRDEFAWYLERLSLDHARARAGLLGTTSTDRPAVDALLSDLEELQAHIETEEYDFFPASRLILDDASWATVAAVHRRLDAAESVPSSS